MNAISAYPLTSVADMLCKTGQRRAGQVHHHQRHAGQVHPAKIGPAQVGVTEVEDTQVNLAQIYAGEHSHLFAAQERVNLFECQSLAG
jgi:hypothetical protein